MFSKRTLAVGVLLAYLVAILTACPAGSPVVPRAVCTALSTHVYPHYRHIEPYVAAADQQLLVSARWRAADAQFGISKRAARHKAAADAHVARAVAAGGVLFEYYKQFLVASGDALVNLLRTKAAVYAALARTHAQNVAQRHIWPWVAKGQAWVASSPYYARFAETTKLDWISENVAEIVRVLRKKSADVSAELTKKAKFINAEFVHMIDPGHHWQQPQDAVDLVKDILEEVTETWLDALGQTEPASTQSMSAASTVIASTLQTAFETTEPQLESEESESEDETVTLHVIVTRTVTLDSVETLGQDSVETLAEDGVASFDDNSCRGQVDSLLKYWLSKVERTLNLASANVETEMAPYLATVIEEIKQRITGNFTALTKANFENYKEMNLMITDINRDSDVIQELSRIARVRVDRQMMRDGILRSHKLVEDAMAVVEADLNAVHAEVLERYFAVAQETVDVLESFAEALMLEFASSLRGLVALLELEPDYEDAIGWSAWKQYHRVKDTIFAQRDRIYDEANSYRANHHSSVPVGMEPWAKYVRDINFHIGFVTRENDEYLQMVRAQANLAYQLREQLTRDIEEKERREAEERALAAEEARREAERALAAASEAAASSLSSVLAAQELEATRYKEEEQRRYKEAEKEARLSFSYGVPLFDLGATSDSDE